MSIASRIIARAQRSEPDFIIWKADGTPYLRRWWLLPRNRVLNIYLHRFTGSDEDRALHDHPWWSLSRILSGSYVEVLPVHQAQPGTLDFTLFGLVRRQRHTGDWIARSATHRHRLEIAPGTECWTLFITGPVLRNWGFHCRWSFVPWQQFLDPKDTGNVGKGCGE